MSMNQNGEKKTINKANLMWKEYWDKEKINQTIAKHTERKEFPHECHLWSPTTQLLRKYGKSSKDLQPILTEDETLKNIFPETPIAFRQPSNLQQKLINRRLPTDDGPAAYSIPMENIKPLLTVGFSSGDISLMNNYDDLSPTIIRSGLKDVVVQWCTQGDLLAVAGMEKQNMMPDLVSVASLKNAIIKFYNVHGEHIYTLDTPVQRPITSICWGHRDSRLFLASGPALYVVRVEHRVACLQLLCQQAIANSLRDDKDIGKLTLPSRLCSYLTTAFIPTIKPPIPDPNNMRDFVSYPTSGNERLHCTMKRTEDDPEVGGPCYTLYLEYLGGLVPVLKGRRISKLRPEFVIMDPKTDGKTDLGDKQPIDKIKRIRHQVTPPKPLHRK
ncbi:tubby-related 4-like [Pelobates cultripes]|uniref:Tubby-related 4-like, partial n=1 Tax=Pelobates cultripes TaxID=61616 RepID=A0AAD1RFC4_PELCU|nr:tubby-related 4-like [Pelobates cultripes]